MSNTSSRHQRMSRQIVALIILVIVVVIAGAGARSFVESADKQTGSRNDLPNKKPARGSFAPTASQWATLTIEPVTLEVFRSEHITEGKIAVDDDRSTLIFSPYSGRVTKLLAKPGDMVAPGDPLFVIEAADMVQAQNDFIAAIGTANKARSQLGVAEIVEKRHRDLYKDKAVSLRELEQAQVGLVAAQNDVRASETALEAVRNRLRILGKTDEEIRDFERTGKINPETSIHAPIVGTIVQRKVGPGQYVNAGASDPIFVIGDLSTVWLIAYVRETEALKIQIGQQLDFTVLASPDQVFKGNVKYIAAALDPSTRRLLVRATIQNRGGVLKPEMFANVKIFTDEGDVAPAVPRAAVIYEGEAARVWIARDDKTIELRAIKPGVSNGMHVQVLKGVRAGEKVVTKGSLFIDRAAASTES
jgi:membrane fusion protein, heavy metal efflux system